MNQLTKPGRKLAKQQILLSVLITFSISIVTYFGWGVGHAKSALIGGAICILPNIAFAFKAFQYAGASVARKVVDAFNNGVKIKLVLTALLFALSFKFFQLELLPFFVTYFLTSLVPFVQAVVNSFSINQQ